MKNIRIIIHLMNQDIPKLKKANFDAVLTLKIDRTIKMELANLKALHGIDTSEWIRRLIRRELPKLKEIAG